ncbi:MAG: ATP-binding protein, partial [Myxococcota bacterium]
RKRREMNSIDSSSILFVDDETPILKALGRTASAMGWPAQTASNPLHALDLLEANDFSVVVADFRMPQMDGVDLLSEVRRRSPRSERILLTAFADEEALERGINEAGISRFLRKPWKREMLVTILEQAMQQARLRRENAVLVERIRSRNEELSYLNRLLQERIDEKETSLIRFRRRWDIALNAISDPIVFLNREFRVEGANDAALEISVFDEHEQLEGQIWPEAAFPNNPPSEVVPVEDGHSRLLLDDGRCVFDVRAYPIPGADAGVLCVYQDVSRIVAFEKEAAHMDKMAAIGRLAGGVAHEINNPLHGILSFVQLAQKPGVAEDKLERYHEVIRECALRCRDIVQSLRDFSRKAKATDRQVVSLQEVCEKSVLLFESVDTKFIETHVDTTGAVVHGSSNQLQQVLVNLIQNALDASPVHGRVKVSVGIEHNSAFLAVDDSGPGVSGDQAEQIFEPFYTTKPEGMGTGLGLAISHSIVQEHGGGLRVLESELGGARFEVRLPLLQEAVSHAG